MSVIMAHRSRLVGGFFRASDHILLRDRLDPEARRKIVQVRADGAKRPAGPSGPGTGRVRSASDVAAGKLPSVKLVRRCDALLRHHGRRREFFSLAGLCHKPKLIGDSTLHAMWITE